MLQTIIDRITTIIEKEGLWGVLLVFVWIIALQALILVSMTAVWAIIELWNHVF